VLLTDSTKKVGDHYHDRSDIDGDPHSLNEVDGHLLRRSSLGVYLRIKERNAAGLLL